MKRLFLLVMIPVALTIARQAPAQNYAPNWESIDKRPTPQWFDDAKFGIFIHWGVFAVPAYHEWYVEFISPKANYGFMFGRPPYTATCGNLPEELCKAKVNADAVKYHLAHWGPNFAYDDFIPMFKAEKFDPATWAQLFQESGARYVIVVEQQAAPIRSSYQQQSLAVLTAVQKTQLAAL